MSCPIVEMRPVSACLLFKSDALGPFGHTIPKPHHFLAPTRHPSLPLWHPSYCGETAVAATLKMSGKRGNCQLESANRLFLAKKTPGAQACLELAASWGFCTSHLCERPRDTKRP